MLRTSLVIPIVCVALLRQTLCSCALDDGPCEYDEIPLSGTDETLWGTTVAMDIAALEVPRPGTWRWAPSTDELIIDESEVELPAVASFVHDAQTLRLREYASGGHGVSCDGPTVEMEGMLTFRDQQDQVIVSIPITVARQHTAEEYYASTPQLSPVELFSTGLHEQDEFDIRRVIGVIYWLPERFLADFDYNGQRMLTETTGNGVFQPVAVFDTDELPP